MNNLLYKDLVYDVVGCALDVHSELGSGFLEAVCEEALCIVLEKKNKPFDLQKRLKIKFQGEYLKSEYVADLVVGNKVIVELKAVSNLKDVYTAQVLNYLKATGLQVGLLINFGVDTLYF